MKSKMVEYLPQILFIGLIFCINIVEPTCTSLSPLGLEDQSIKDEQISSTGNIYNGHVATQVRLNIGKGWCVQGVAQSYLAIDFNQLITVSMIATQGTESNGTELFVPRYRIQFGYNGKDWFNYTVDQNPQEFKGNNDNITVVNNTIHKTMTKHMKIIPILDVGQSLTCLRMEIYGCKSSLKPNVETKPDNLILKNKEMGSITCNAKGQVGLNSKWMKKSTDLMATESFSMNKTNGIFYNESKSLNIKEPSSMDDEAYDATCKVNMREAVVICQRNYTCKAEYEFDKNLFTEKQVDVLLKKDVSISMTVDNGLNTAIYTTLKKNKTVPCLARSQDPLIIQWRNKDHGEWASQTSVTKNQTNGHLNLVQEVTVSLRPNAVDVIDRLKCKKSSWFDNALECLSNFTCNAFYQRNTTISVEKRKEVFFVIYPPSKPDSLQAECGSKQCTLTWAQTQIGDFTKKDVQYFLQLEHGKTVTHEATVEEQKYTFYGLLPNRIYAVLVMARIKNWESAVAKEQFTTVPIPPASKVIFKPYTATSNSLNIEWQQLDLPLESGYLLKYDFKLVQLKYGEREMDKVDGMQKIFIEDNLTNTTSRKTFNGLRPWSTYEFSILPINNHLQRGTNEAQLLVTTEESVPTKPPSSLQISLQTRQVKLEWSQPPYVNRNGHIVQYQIEWKRVEKRQKNKRDLATYKQRVGTPNEFNCASYNNICMSVFEKVDPYQNYVFRIAARTKKGLGPFTPEKSVLTTQDAPSAPLFPASNESKPTFYLMWQKPMKPNGEITEYEVEMEIDAKRKAIFTVFTFYDTKLSSAKTMKFRVRGYTEYLHNNGGHPGDWTSWTVAKRFIKPIIRAKPVPQENDNTSLVIGVSFGLVIFVLIIAIIFLIFLYRRRQRSDSRRKLEVEMDSIADGENEKDIHLVSGENVPLAGSHETVDIPAEDHAHLPVPVEEFHTYVSHLREEEDELICHQYKYELMSGKCYSTEIGQRPENKPKNRYVNIAAYDHSRVILRPEGGKKIIHHRESDYFNANHIDGYCPQSSSKYIASQGPMESVFADFWRMVWQENISVIIMLTNLEEGGKVKCDQYWPSQGACKYGHITVRFIRADQTADYYIRSFDIEKGTGKDKIKRALMQFHFISWPDYGVPEFPTAILSLRRRVRHHYAGDGPMLVHCSAGVGRTGCFILIDAMLERIDNGEGSIDIFNYLQYMRTRRINMVQTSDQYIFAHLSILEYLTFGDTEISVIDFEKKFKELQKADGIENEFSLIESTSPDIESIDNSCKVLLKDGRFIDVFYIDGYKQRDAFLLCNSPSENMTPDFWKMLIEHNCHTVVMLNRLEEGENHKYWPDMNSHYCYGDYSIVMTSEQTNGNIVTRKFKITSTSSPEEHFQLQHFQFLDWPSDAVPQSRNSILTLMSLIEKSRQHSGNGPVLVHSGNGAGRSGTFIAIYNSTERLKVEQLIDIPQCVRAIRTVVPNAIGVKRQYEFIYEMIRTYLQAFETYSNFSDPTLSTEEI